MSNNHQALRATGLHKQYGNRWVVSDVDIEVNKGEIIGLLGPNGAGKTTTFYMITGMIKPTKGRIFWMIRKLLIKRCTCARAVVLVIWHKNRQFSEN